MPCVAPGSPSRGDRLGCPITAIGASEDQLVSSWQLQAWDAQTNGRFELLLLPGSHCFLRASRSRVLVAIQDRLRRAPGEALRQAS